MEKTHHLISTAEFQRLKKPSRIVNTARGRVVDEAALVQALKDGQLVSAALDVHYNEPKVSLTLIHLPL